MKSKISCFNKTIFKKNFTQFWPLWAAYLFTMILAMPVSLYQQMQRNYYMDKPVAKQLAALQDIFEVSTEPALLFFFATLAVMAVFSYLYTSKNANGIHALPVTRLELFVTNYLSAFGYLAVIQIFVFVLSVFVAIGCGVTNIEILFYALLMQLGMLFFATAFSTCIAMLTGHILAMPVYCLIANFLYVVICYILTYFVSTINYGLSVNFKDNITYVLSPLYYLSDKINSTRNFSNTSGEPDRIIIEGGGTVAGYVVAAVFVLILAYRFYKRRQMETAGDIIAVKFMKPVFRIGSGLCIGLTGGMVLTDILYNYKDYTNEIFWAILLWSLFWGAVAYFGAEMLMQKNFRVFKKKILIEAAATFGVLIIGAAFVKLDVLGVETNIPAKEEIVCAFTQFNYPLKFEGEELDEMIEVHKQIIAAKEENLSAYSNGEPTRNIQFRYYLKDGSSYDRRYQIPVNEENPLDETMIGYPIISLEMDGEEMAKHLFGNGYETNSFLSGYIYRYDEYLNSFEYRFTEEETQVIAEAVMKDVLEGNFSAYQFYNYKDTRDYRYVNNLQLTFYNENGFESDEDIYWDGIYSDNADNIYVMGVAETAEAVAVDTTYSYSGVNGKIDTQNVYLDFGTKCVHTVKALEELGIVNENWKLYTQTEWDELNNMEK